MTPTGQAARPAALASFFRRDPEAEATGQWLSDRSGLAWPDAMVSDRAVRWFPRLLLVVAVAVCAVTAPAISGPRSFWMLVGLAIAAGAWFEWWVRWDLTRLYRRVLAFVVQWLLMAGMVWINPFAAFYAFVGYILAGTLFSGWLQILGVFLTALVVAGSQVGGHAQVLADVPLFIGVLAINFAIALGFVTLSARRENAVRRRDEAMGELMAAQQANLALHDQLIDQATRSGVQQERARLARDLHDTVAQGLVAVITQLESIDDRGLAADVSRRVESAKELARQSLSEARRAVHALGATDLDDHPLPYALRAVASSWSAQNPVRVEVKSSGRQRASRSDTDLIRVCQEALSNIARHARATSVTITLTYLDDRVLLDIRDDGVGFDLSSLPRPGPDGGHGLAGMRARLASAGGELVVESGPRAGCVVSAAMPL